MQIFDAAQIHAWDEYTIRNEPVTSLELMERAAAACYAWLLSNGYENRRFAILCGKGNNGGDGLALARMLSRGASEVAVYILEFGHKGTEDFQQNLALLHETTASIAFIPNEAAIPELTGDQVIIDAIFGSGLNRHLEGLTAELVARLNGSGSEIISIDLPTGLFADRHSESHHIVKALHTLTFQSLKFAFLLRESQQYLGQVHVLDIGLHPGFLTQTSSKNNIIDEPLIRSIIKRREKFSHKGDYGSGALITGSKGMIGASVLCARAFMRSGAGKLTCHVPDAGYIIMQVSIPEAMCKVEKGQDHIVSVDNLDKYDSVAIGPGLGLADSHKKLLKEVFEGFHKPIVIDADALNILSRNMNLAERIPADSILTPHTREFDRMFGASPNDHERILLAMQKAAELKLIIVLKGPYTLIAMPGGLAYFNSTGNPGMATGGSGDVLTGVISSLLCQGYDPSHAAVLGVYIHGMAGDLAARKYSMQSMIASNIIDELGNAFLHFE